MVLILTRSKHAANRYGEIERIGVVSSKAFFPSSSSSFFFFFILLCVFEFLNCIPFLSLFFPFFFYLMGCFFLFSLFIFYAGLVVVKNNVVRERGKQSIGNVSIFGLKGTCWCLEVL